MIRYTDTQEKGVLLERERRAWELTAASGLGDAVGPLLRNASPVIARSIGLENLSTTTKSSGELFHAFKTSVPHWHRYTVSSLYYFFARSAMPMIPTHAKLLVCRRPSWNASLVIHFFIPLRTPSWNYIVPRSYSSRIQCIVNVKKNLVFIRKRFHPR